MPTPTRGFDMLWISERMAINPNSILWVFRGAHGELEITFAGGKQLTLNEQELSGEGRAILLPASERVSPATATEQSATLRMAARNR